LTHPEPSTEKKFQFSLVAWSVIGFCGGAMTKQPKNEAEVASHKLFGTWFDPLDAPLDIDVLAVVDGRPTIAIQRTVLKTGGTGPVGWCHSSAMSHMSDRFRGVTAWTYIPALPNRQG
jgi:hypothetical protein